MVKQIILAIEAVVIMLALSSCSVPQGTRCVVAWGIWAAPLGQPIGVGYWSSAHGNNVSCSKPAGPSIP